MFLLWIPIYNTHYSRRCTFGTKIGFSAARALSAPVRMCNVYQWNFSAKWIIFNFSSNEIIVYPIYDTRHVPRIFEELGTNNYSSFWNILCWKSNKMQRKSLEIRNSDLYVSIFKYGSIFVESNFKHKYQNWIHNSIYTLISFK